MATHDYVIDNGSGSTVRADINSALQAIVTVNSNNTEPSAVFDKMLWHDGTENALKQRN
ncbi:MAG: phage tail protein, partial [Synechococcaceae bacterium WBB_34_004]|nr:phage tail protein [Synechococcaceae bacterium WBB_34_004]